MTSRFRIPMSTPTYVAAALVMGAASLVESGAGGGFRPAGITGLAVVSAAAITVSLVVARWSPPAGLLVLVAALAAISPLSDLPPVGGAHLIVMMLLVGLAGYRCTLRVGLACYVVAVLAPAGLIVAAGEAVWEFLFFALILGPAWVVGLLLRRERQRSAELERLTEELRAERERQAEVAVAAERTRISRELHDAVAHTVSVMTLQVGVVRRRLGADSVEGETLLGAETLGRQAVDELRRIVGLVREGEAAALAPLPSLGQLDDLVDRVRGAGTDVRLHVEGDRVAVPSAVDMSAYRILQEALTNAMRHAPGAAVDVVVAVERDVLRLQVANEPPRGPVDRPATGGLGGNGLPGMRERVSVLGGTLEAGPRDDGGFTVSASLPVPA